MFRSFFSAFLLLLFSVHASAAEPESLDSIIRQAQSRQLSQHPTWHKLMVYEPKWFSGKTESAIHAESFFNAPDGKTNPEAELIATLEALAQPVEADPDLHARCRFPARFIWLKEQLDLPDSIIPATNCPEFDQWSMKDEVDSLSIVFATGFLGNPASYYGHTLLKLNARDEDRTRLLDVSVNYGAIVPDNEDPITYIIKGLFGGYDAGFSHTEFYFHNQSYGEIELRDLWEYELNLTDDDVKLILAHTWETMGKEYTYYFLNKNCAYRMGQLFEIIDGIKVNPDTNLWVIPQAQVLQLGDAQYNGKPLIREVHFQPSRQSRLYERYSKLDTEQKAVVKESIDDISILESSSFNDQPLDSQYQVLDTLLDYYQFADKLSDKDDEASQQSYRQTLTKRYMLPPGGAEELSHEPSSPHQGRSPSLIQAGITRHSQHGNGAALTIRPAYYDALDSGPEHIEYAELIMGQLSLESFSGMTRISGIDVISIQSLNTDVTGLPGDTNAAWRLKAGLQMARMSCHGQCLAARVEGDRGYSWKVSDDLVLGAYLGGAVQDNRQGTGNVEARFTSNAIMDLSSNIRARAEYQHRRQIDAGKNLNDLQIDVRYRLEKNWDIRFSYHSAESEQFSILLGRYW